MNKHDIIDQLHADHPEIPKYKISAIVNGMLAHIRQVVASGERVSIPKFGVFTRRQVKARKGRNPTTGDVVDVPACAKPAFKAGKTFKRMCN